MNLEQPLHEIEDAARSLVRNAKVRLNRDYCELLVATKKRG